MRQSTEEWTVFPVESARDALTDVLREGAQRLLAEAVEALQHPLKLSGGQILGASNRPSRSARLRENCGSAENP